MAMARAAKAEAAGTAAGGPGAGDGGAARRRGLLGPLALGLGLAAALGSSGFYAAWSGILPLPGAAGAAEDGLAPPARRAETGFVPIAPMVISLGPEARARHLRFAGALEVPAAHLGEVQRQMPRVLDLLNGYLRAVDARAFDEPTALVRLRAQMLRRVRIVLGEALVRDLLVTEFVLN